jgi:hypothetical protein
MGAKYELDSPCVTFVGKVAKMLLLVVTVYNSQTVKCFFGSITNYISFHGCQLDSLLTQTMTPIIWTGSRKFSTVQLIFNRAFLSLNNYIQLSEMGRTCNPITYGTQRELLSLDKLVNPPLGSKSIHFRLHPPIMMMTMILNIISSFLRN